MSDLISEFKMLIDRESTRGGLDVVGREYIRMHKNRAFNPSQASEIRRHFNHRSEILIARERFKEKISDQ